METIILNTREEIEDFFNGKIDSYGRNAFFSLKGSKIWAHRIFCVHQSSKEPTEGWRFIVGQKDLAKEGVIMLDEELNSHENVYKIKISEITEITLEPIHE